MVQECLEMVQTIQYSKDFKEQDVAHYQIEDTQPYYGIKKVDIQLP